MEDIIKECKVIIADTEARNVDKLTLGCAERLLEKIKNVVAQNEVLRGGRSEWANAVEPRP